MRIKSHAIALALVAALALSGCGAIRAITGGDAGTIAALWPDVPGFPGAVKADLALPAAARIMIQQAAQGKVNFIAYTAANLPPDVMAYYTVERMKAAGWNADSTGCVGDKQSLDGGFCFFARKTAGGDVVLVVVVSRDAKDKPTQIYYARVEPGTPAPR